MGAGRVDQGAAGDEERERRLDELEALFRTQFGDWDPVALAAEIKAGLAASTAAAEARRVRDFEDWFALGADGPDPDTP